MSTTFRPTSTRCRPTSTTCRQRACSGRRRDSPRLSAHPVCPGFGGCSQRATCALGNALVVTSASMDAPCHPQQRACMLEVSGVAKRRFRWFAAVPRHETSLSAAAERSAMLVIRGAQHGCPLPSTRSLPRSSLPLGAQARARTAWCWLFVESLKSVL
jgi:hypothetical protein